MLSWTTLREFFLYLTLFFFISLSSRHIHSRDLCRNVVWNPQSLDL